MIKDQNTTVAYHCPFCGMPILNPVTMFSTNGNLIKLKCVCGGSELVIHITKDKKVRITVPCIVCPNSHSFTVSSNIFFERELFAFSCTFTSINICFIGKYAKVYNAIKKNEEELLKAFAQYENDYYPDIPDNSGFTASFPGDNDNGNNHSHEHDHDNHSHNKSGIDLFNPLGNFEYPDDLDDLDETEFWNFWDDGQFGGDDTNDMEDIYLSENMSDKSDKAGKKYKRKSNEQGFELYKTGDIATPQNYVSALQRDNLKIPKNKKSNTAEQAQHNSFKFVEIDGNDFSKIKIKNYPIILQILDVVSNLYKENKIFCKCGHFNGKIALWENSVHVECKDCASQRDIKSTTIADIEYIAELGELYLDFD